ncbi:hypothetical protein KY285_028743 [Solanum tuberosum]|nr:hypothetical protein KY289_028943 [Solanum tuberosum]KAH0663845.1 hypothetical protein KY284_028776 [Solanum tuberosum]KAH0667537.1 hypothetical protein KY285_028743 [Solanum tuberosum]
MMVAIIKLLRDKREVVVRRMRRDIGMLLESRPDVTVRIQNFALLQDYSLQLLTVTTRVFTTEMLIGKSVVRIIYYLS